MNTDVVGLYPVGPHRLQARGTNIAIAETIAVVVGRDKVPAGPLEHLEACLLEEANHTRVKPLQVVSGHQRHSTHVESAFASAEDLKYGFFRVDPRSDVEWKSLVFARE